MPESNSNPEEGALPPLSPFSEEGVQRPLAPVPEEGAQRPSRRAGHLLSWSAAFFLIVQLVALYLPGSPDGGLELPGLPGADKVVHFLIFAIPVYLFGRLSGRVGLVAGLFAVHAVVSEFVQWRFVPYRDGDVWDAVTDLLGIGMAALAVLYTKPTSRR